MVLATGLCRQQYNASNRFIQVIGILAQQVIGFISQAQQYKVLSVAGQYQYKSVDSSKVPASIFVFVQQQDTSHQVKLKGSNMLAYPSYHISRRYQYYFQPYSQQQYGYPLCSHYNVAIALQPVTSQQHNTSRQGIECNVIELTKQFTNKLNYQLLTVLSTLTRDGLRRLMQNRNRSGNVVKDTGVVVVCAQVLWDECARVTPITGYTLLIKIFLKLPYYSLIVKY